MHVQRQGVRFGPHKSEWAERNKPLAWLTCLPYLCTRPGGVFVSQRRFKGYEDRVVRASQSTVHNWNERLADQGLEFRLDTLPEQLQRLWDEGMPLEGDTALSTYVARRAALRLFWQSRTDTPHGKAVRQAVEGFVRGVVQSSAHPFPPDEADWFASKATLQDP
jgi:hypothetical protein